jgi:hypothetical protein
MNRKQTKSFDQLLQNVIEDTLKDVFKEIGAQFTYNFLKSNYDLDKEGISENPEIFSTGLAELFNSGGIAIEKLILSKMRHKLKVNYDGRKHLSFKDHITKLRKISVRTYKDGST